MPTKNLDPTRAILDLRPVHTCTMRTQAGPNSLLDPTFWESVHHNSERRRAWMTTLSHEALSYEQGVGQSSREDYHREYAVLYGMRPLLRTAADGEFARYVNLLNAFEDVHAGRTRTYEKEVVVEFEPVPAQAGVFTPLAEVQQVLALLDLLSPLFGLRFTQIPRWSPRIQSNGLVYRRRPVTVQRPKVTTKVTVTEPLDKLWRNPNQVDMRFLLDTQSYNFKGPDCEGLSLLVTNTPRKGWTLHKDWTPDSDADDDDDLVEDGDIGAPLYHLVQWVTGKRHNGRWGKRPLAVQVLHGMDLEQATVEMDRVRQAMARTTEWENLILPWQAAEIVRSEERDPEVDWTQHEVNFSPDVIQAIVLQKESNEVYRSKGQNPSEWDGDDE